MLNRRALLRGAAGAGLAAAAGQLPLPALAGQRTIRIGFVSPQTGPLATFAEPDAFVLDQFRRKLADGMVIGGRSYPVEILVKDSQSSSNRASTVAQELILKDEVDILCATATPDTTNPVADMAELNGVPCVTNDTPWQPHFFGRQGTPRLPAAGFHQLLDPGRPAGILPQGGQRRQGLGIPPIHAGARSTRRRPVGRGQVAREISLPLRRRRASCHDLADA